MVDAVLQHSTGQWTNHMYPTTCSSCSYLPSCRFIVKILMLLPIYVAILQFTSPSLILYSIATTSMFPELPSKPFVKRCNVCVLRASPCVSLGSFVKTTMSLSAARTSQSTISQAETERDASTKVELDTSNETMSDVCQAFSPLGVLSLACLSRFLCSCFFVPLITFADPDPPLFGVLQLRSNTPVFGFIAPTALPEVWHM